MAGLNGIVKKGSGKLSPEDERLKKLEWENRDLREENEILKKAAA